MTEVDFVISTVIIISVISFAIFYSTTNFSNQTKDLEVQNLEKASLYLSNQIESKLAQSFGVVQSIYKENGGYAHREKIKLTLKPAGLQKLHVYDKTWNEIPAVIKQKNGGVDIDFDLSFNANENKEVKIVYYGPSIIDIEYKAPKDISAKILSEKTINLISQTKCSEFKTKPYDQAKVDLNSDTNFKINITDCTFGLEPPNATVVIATKPFLIENSNGLVIAESSRIIVW